MFLEMFGDDGVYKDLQGWTKNTPIELYITKDYKMYSVQYQRVIFMCIIRLITSFNKQPREEWFNFIGKDGEIWRGEFKETDEIKKYDLVEHGKENMEEFIKFYAQELVFAYIEEDLEPLNKIYRDSLFRDLVRLQEFLFKNGIREFLDVYGETFMDIKSKYLTRWVQENVDEYFDKTSKEGDMYTNKWYRELQDRTMEHIRVENEKRRPEMYRYLDF